MNDSMVESQPKSLETKFAKEFPTEHTESQRGYLDFHNHIQRLSDRQMPVFVRNCLETYEANEGDYYIDGVAVGISCLDDKFKPEL